MYQLLLPEPWAAIATHLRAVGRPVVFIDVQVGRRDLTEPAGRQRRWCSAAARGPSRRSPRSGRAGLERAGGLGESW